MLCWKVHVKSKIHWKSLEMGEHNSYLMLSAQRHHRNVDSSTMCTFFFFTLVCDSNGFVTLSPKRNDCTNPLYWVGCVAFEGKRTHTHRERESLFWNYYPFAIDQVISPSTRCATQTLCKALYTRIEIKGSPTPIKCRTNGIGDGVNSILPDTHTQKNCMNIAWI